MRRASSTLVAFVAVGLAGCKNQGTSTFTNPFLTPDRVPPPSTRVLAPGTAAPYYPGDPPPGVAPAVGAPAVGAPVYGPGTTLPTTSPYPGASPPLTNPPGGWGAYPPQSSASPGGESIGVPRDDQGLRFAAAGVGAGVGDDPARLSNAPPASSLSFGAPAGARLPIQSLLPLAADQPAAPPRPQQLQPREVTPAEYLAGVGAASGASLASAESTRDGFRPQGSQPRAARNSDDSFRPPAIRRDAVEAAASNAAQYGMGAQQEWIRGQLEYWPASGQWSIRYAPLETPADAGAGRVMIANPQVLANLSPGELVVVEGQLFAQATESGAMQPAYRVAAVQRQRQ